MFSKLLEQYKRVIFFDTETTGFDPEKTDQMIELAAMSIDAYGNERQMNEFIRLFRMKKLPDQISSLTGIVDLTLATNGIEEIEALKMFIEMIKGEGKTLLVAHNAQFDLKFIAYAIYRNKDAGQGWMRMFNECDYLDTLTVYKDRRRYPHKLEAAVAEYHLAGKVENSHRAIDDCKALFEVAKAMDKEKPDLHRYINLFGFNPKYGPEAHQFKKVTYAPQSLWNCPPAVPTYESIQYRR